MPVPQLFYLQLPQLPSRATFPPRTTELSAAPVLSCAQYRPAAAFPTSGPVYLRCVTSSRSHSIPTPGQQHTYYIAAPRTPAWPRLHQDLTTVSSSLSPSLAFAHLQSPAPSRCLRTGAGQCFPIVSLYALCLYSGIYSGFDHTYSVVPALRFELSLSLRREVQIKSPISEERFEIKSPISEEAQDKASLQ